MYVIATSWLQKRFFFSSFTLAGVGRVFFVVLLLICFLSGCLICYPCYWGFLSSSVKLFFHREAFYYMTNWFDILKKLGKKTQTKSTSQSGKMVIWLDLFSLPDGWWAVLQVQWLRCRQNVGKGCLGVAVESHFFHEIICIKLQSNISLQFPRICFLCCFKGAWLPYRECLCLTFRTVMKSLLKKFSKNYFDFA